jgi:hypothetical protein
MLRNSEVFIGSGLQLYVQIYLGPGDAGAVYLVLDKEKEIISC